MPLVKHGAYWVAVVLIVLLVVWLATGDISTASDTAPEPLQVHQEQALPKVAFRPLHAERVEETLTVQGVIEPDADVVLASRLDSAVAEVAVAEGQAVTRGDLLLKLDEEDLPARIRAAEARVAKAESELSASRSLSGRGLTSEADLRARQAELADAQAQWQSLQTMLGFIRIQAPFSGVVETIDVEAGESVRKGDPLIHLVSNRQLKMVGQVPQQWVGAVKEGMTVRGRLLDGEAITGTVSYIGTQADPRSRTYRLEAAFPNTASRRLSGSTVALDIVLGPVLAHSLSPAFLTLNAAGALAIQHVSDDDTVLETPVQRIKATADTIWVTGLPEHIRLLTLGKGFVSVGEKVNPQPETQLSQAGP